MENYKYEGSFFDDFFVTSKKAKLLAFEQNKTVEFDFNGITCMVSKDTNLDLLYRDYSNAHLMEWKTVGPDCVAEYNEKTSREMEEKQQASDKKEAERQVNAQLENEKQQRIFELKTKGVVFELRDEKSWLEYKEKNKDGYGGACIEYAESWAKLMQVEIDKHAIIRQNVQQAIEACASKTSHELGFIGITGFMYGCAVQMLSQCWRHGEVLRKWHNKEYNHEGDGVVNPAVLTIKSK